jgi:hypothetical protein
MTTKYKIQSIIFDNSLNSYDESLRWVLEHGYKPLKVDFTTHFFRFRILEPSDLEKKGYVNYRNKVFDKIKIRMFVIAYK